jgi:hypothetical protein
MKWPVYTEEDRKRVAKAMSAGDEWANDAPKSKAKQYTDEERRLVWAAFKEAAVAASMAVAKMAGEITEAATNFSDAVRRIDKQAEERRK